MRAGTKPCSAYGASAAAKKSVQPRSWRVKRASSGSMRLGRPRVQLLDPALRHRERRHVPADPLLVGDGGVHLPEDPLAVDHLVLCAVELRLLAPHESTVLGGGGEPAG